MAATAMSLSTARIGVRTGAPGSAVAGSSAPKRMAIGGRSFSRSPRDAGCAAVMASSATGAPGRKESLSSGDARPNGVWRAKRARRGTVIIEAAEGIGPSPVDQDDTEPEPSFIELFFTESENKGKDFAPWYYRIFCVIVYLIPAMGAIAFTGQAFMQYNNTFSIAVGISPLLQIYYSNSFIPFLAFFGLFLGVVRNIKMNHFFRYNVMQAILLDICVMLAGLIMQYMPMSISCSVIGDMIEISVLVNALYAIGYCMWNSILGIYPEIPIITEAVYAQVRDVN